MVEGQRLMACDLLDLQCIFVGELIGNMVLTFLLGIIFYFILASKLRFGFTTTIVVAIPFLFIFGLAIGGISSVMAFAALFIGVFLAWTFSKIIGN